MVDDSKEKNFDPQETLDLIEGDYKEAPQLIRGNMLDRIKQLRSALTNGPENEQRLCGGTGDASEIPSPGEGNDGDIPHIIWFDDPSLPPELIIGRKPAARRFEMVSQNWNGHLFAKIESNAKDDPYYECNIEHKKY